MKAVILAAGVSSRLRPLTNDTPKCLIKVGNKTILERTLNNLTANDIKDIIIVTGYLENQIRDYISKKYPQLSVQYIFNNLYESTNNIYSLWMTKEYVLNNDVLLLDSDIIFDKRIIELLLNSKYENCLAINSKDELGNEEIKVKVNPDNSIIDINKEVNLNEAVGESIGIEKFNSLFVEKLFKVLDKKILVEKNVNQFYEAAFQEVIDSKSKIYAVDVGKYRCIEIDTFDDMENAKSQIINYLN